MYGRAPGGQSAAQTCGRGDAAWRESAFDVEASVRVIERVASRYASSPALVGIELLNEPTLPTAVLLEYYRRASIAVRRAGAPPERVAVVINLYGVDAILWQAWGSFNWRLPAAEHPNIVYDLHLYYANVASRPLPATFDLLPLSFVTSHLVELQSALLSIAGRRAIQR